MPRRAKDDTVTDTSATASETVAPDASEATAVAGGSNETNGEQKTKRSALDEMPLGPTKTRTGAEATVIQGPQGKRVFTAGGDKGQKIAELLRTRSDLPRKEIAAMVGCSQSRVAEVARVLGLASARPTATTPEEPPTEPQPTEPAQPQPETVST